MPPVTIDILKTHLTAHMSYWFRYAAVETHHDSFGTKFQPRFQTVPQQTRMALLRRNLIEEVRLRWKCPEEKREGARTAGIQLDAEGVSHFTEFRLTREGHQVLERLHWSREK